jgi:hypothetical protein
MMAGIIASISYARKGCDSGTSGCVMSFSQEAPALASSQYPGGVGIIGGDPDHGINQAATAC